MPTQAAENDWNREHRTLGTIQEPLTSVTEPVSDETTYPLQFEEMF
jgi:hypothetical protein